MRRRLRKSLPRIQYLTSALVFTEKLNCVFFFLLDAHVSAAGQQQYMVYSYTHTHTLCRVRLLAPGNYQLSQEPKFAAMYVCPSLPSLLPSLTCLNPPQHPNITF